MQFGFEELYPSILKELFTESSNICENFSKYQSWRKSLLLTNTDIWIKKNGNPDFDVTMDNFDGAELCQLVGL